MRQPEYLTGVAKRFQYAARVLRRSPQYTAGVVFSLSVGAAAVVIGFGILDAVALRPFPGIHRQHELVRVDLHRVAGQGTGRMWTTSEAHLMFEEGLTSVTRLGAYHQDNFSVLAAGQALALTGALVSDDFFQTLGIVPELGRVLGPSDTQHVVIGHLVWTSVFGSDPDVIGRTISVNGRPFAIAGVAPHGFRGIDGPSDKKELWLLLSAAPQLFSTLGGPTGRATSGPEFLQLRLVGRLREGTTIQQAQAQAAALWSGASMINDGSITAVLVGRLTRTSLSWAALLAFLSVPTLVLIIACGNAATLARTRASARTRQWAVQLALGATRGTLVRQAITEGLLLAVIAGAGALLLTLWSLRLFQGLIPVALGVDLRVSVFAAFVVLCLPFLFSLLPAWTVSREAMDRTSLSSSLTASHVRYRGRTVTVAVQAALAFGLLLTGVQFAATLKTSESRDGIRGPETLFLATFNLAPLQWTTADVDGFYAQLVERGRRERGLSDVSLSCACEIWGAMSADGAARIWLSETSSDAQRVVGILATGELPAAIGLSLKAGRQFREADIDPAAGGNVVIVNEAFAREHFQGHALGRSFLLAPARGERAVARQVEIVGVVTDPEAVSGVPPLLRNDRRPTVLYPRPLEPLAARRLYFRTSLPTTQARAAIERLVREVDNRVPIVSVANVSAQRRERTASHELLSRGVLLLGAAGLLLAAAGLYSVIGYVVALRWRELGIRLALGAERGALLREVAGPALGAVLVGAAVGAVGAIGTGHFVRSRLYGTSLLDPQAAAVAMVVLLLVSLLAVAVPTRRIMKLDPAAVLRQD